MGKSHGNARSKQLKFVVNEGIRRRPGGLSRRTAFH
jgi:hypothetical protein